MKNNNVLYICGDVRSGSTLLDMILGRHPALTSVGELHFLHDYLNGTYHREVIKGKGVKENCCTCGKVIFECPFWKSVLNKYNAHYNEHLDSAKTRFPFNKKRMLSRYFFNFRIANIKIHKLTELVDNANGYREFKKIAFNRFCLYETINDVQQSEFVVDSSKSIEGLKFLLACEKNNSVKALFMLRDLRAIAYSKFKRRGESQLFLMALQTMLFHIRLYLTVKSIPGQKRLVIKYEDLVTDTEGTLKTIFKFLGIDDNREVDLHSFYESHILGGSPRRLTNKQLNIEMDERWKKNYKGMSIVLSKTLFFVTRIFNIK